MKLIISLVTLSLLTISCTFNSSLNLFPTSTPVSAYHPQLLPVFEELLAENGRCDLPCFWGFNLGLSSDEEWLDFYFENHLDEGWAEINFDRQGGGGTYSLARPYNDVQLGFGLKNQHLSAIRLALYQPNEWLHLDENKFSLAALLQQLESPFELYWRYRSSLRDFQIVVVADDLGLIAYYSFDITNNMNFDNLELCLDISHTTEINLMLQDNSAYDTLLSDPLRTAISVGDYRQLNELGIDEEVFARFMIEHPDECFVALE